MIPEFMDRTALNQLYNFTFNAAKDTAYITHAATGAPIGYDYQCKLVTAASPWRVYHDGNETILYATIANKNYILWLNITDGGGGNSHAGLLPADPQSSMLKPGTWTTRTTSPYFSPKRAMAPSFFASSMASMAYT